MEPLDKDDLDTINQGLAALKEVREQITRAEQAGLTMEDQKERVRVDEERLLGIKRAFFPRAKA